MPSFSVGAGGRPQGYRLSIVLLMLDGHFGQVFGQTIIDNLELSRGAPRGAAVVGPCLRFIER